MLQLLLLSLKLLELLLLFFEGAVAVVFEAVYSYYCLRLQLLLSLKLLAAIDVFEDAADVVLVF